MNAFFATVLVTLAAAAVFILMSLALWWLVPVAFLVQFSFLQAMATAALMLLFGGVVTASK